MNDSERAFYASYRGAADSSSAAAAASSLPLCAQWGVSVSYAGSDRGKIVTATRAIPRGSVAWVESPLVGMSHLSSSRLHAGCVCSRCLRAVGSMQHAWQRASTVAAEDAQAARDKARRKAAKHKKKSNKTKAAEATADAEPAAATDPLPPSLPAQLPFLDTAASDAASSFASTADAAPPSSSILRLPLITPLPCLSGCSAVYCSAACRDSEWREGHELLCAAPWRAAGPATADDASTAAAAASSSAAAASAASSSPAPIDPAYTRLLKHASAHNEIFLLAAQSVALMTLDALRRFRSDARVHSAMGLADADPLVMQPNQLLPFALRLHAHLRSLPAALSSSFLSSTLSPLVSAATAPFLQFCGGCWWEHVGLPSDLASTLDADDEADYRQALCGVAEQALTAFSELAASKIKQAAAATAISPAASALVAAPSAPAPVPAPSFDSFVSLLGLDSLYSLSLWGRLLSSFDRNNIGFHAPTQLGLYVAHIRGLADEERAAAVAQIGSELWAEMQRRVDGGDSSSGGLSQGCVEGTGLFVIGCCMNHSCDPNVTLRRKHASADDEPTEINDEQLRGQFERMMDQGWNGEAASDAAAAASSAVSASALSASRPSPSSVLPAALLDRRAVFVALRDISAGEELNISYIELMHTQSHGDATDQSAADAAAPATAASPPAAAASSSPSDPAFSASAPASVEVGFADRQRQLRSYDFVCKCVKCARESG